MKISLQATVIMGAIFAIVCFGVGIRGFLSLGDVADPAQVSAARGFAWFWTFLGAVGAGFGALGWWLARTGAGTDDA
jgi:hypothetical protein